MRTEILLPALLLFLPFGSAPSYGEPASLENDENEEWTEAPFDAEHWNLAGAEVVEHLGRTCLRGGALLKDAELENGVIEVEVAVTGERCFPAIHFRRDSPAQFENVYLRPHSPGKADAVQYAPVFNGQTEWQLCTGEGFIAAAPIPWNEWIHLRLEVHGTQARVFVDHADEPALRVHHLKHEPHAAALALAAPPGGLVHWADFRYVERNDLLFPPSPPIELPEGTITDWQVSQPIPVTRLDFERYPLDQELGELRWEEVFCQPNGQVDVSRLYRRAPRLPEAVVALATIHAGEKGRTKLLFGYSDEVSLFLNGKIFFRGNAAFRSRSPMFLGAIGWHDAVFLDLEAGENELLLMVAEDFGGWGFQARTSEIGAPAIRIDPALAEEWLTPTIFAAPESVVFDPERELLYVTNYYASAAGGTEFISQVGLDGTMAEGRWITGLNHPTGIALFDGRVWFVERESLTEADVETGEILARHSFPDPGFPNDVTFDSDGNAYVSDGAKGRVYRLADGELEVWFDGVHGFQPNGLFTHGGELYAGNSADGSVLAIDLKGKTLRFVAHLGLGSIVDGIHVGEDGRVLTGDYNGRLFRFDREGNRTVLLDTTRARHNLADFVYLADRDLLVIPTLAGGHLRAYTLAR